MTKWFVDGMEVKTELEDKLVHGFIDLKKRTEALEQAREAMSDQREEDSADYESRLEALEAFEKRSLDAHEDKKERIATLEDVHISHAARLDTCADMIEQHERRLRELEERSRLCPHGFNRKNIFCTECDSNLDRPAENAERDRQARWHATRDAVLPELLVMRICDGDRDPEGTAILQANAVADRAHGPLEGKAEAGSYNEGFREGLASVRPHPDINIGGVTVGEVAALVKAAGKAELYLREGAGDDFDMADELAVAIKPFEVNHG